MYLRVIVDIDHVNRSVCITDEEHRVFLRLKSLQQVHICSTVYQDKILVLEEETTIAYRLDSKAEDYCPNKSIVDIYIYI